MMGIVVPETCRASNKICNKKHLLHLVGIYFHISNYSSIWSGSFGLGVEVAVEVISRRLNNHQEVENRVRWWRRHR